VEHAEVIRIEALLDPCDVASRRVGENSGFQPDGQLRLYLELNLHPWRRARVRAARSDI
jgi:RimJ/RimL family protein N-acetyltransferase